MSNFPRSQRGGFSTNYKLTPVRMAIINNQRQHTWNQMRVDFNNSQQVLVSRASLDPRGTRLPLTLRPQDGKITPGKYPITFKYTRDGSRVAWEPHVHEPPAIAKRRQSLMNLHPSYTYKTATAGNKNYGPGTMVWKDTGPVNDRTTKATDMSLTMHTTVVDHKPTSDATAAARHEIHVEAPRVSFAEDGTRKLPDIRWGAGAAKARAQASHAPSWFGGRIHTGYVSSAKSDYSSPYFVTHMTPV